MRTHALIVMLVAGLALGTSEASERPERRQLRDVCGSLPEMPDACEIAKATAEMLSPTYEDDRDKPTKGVETLEKLGYKVRHVDARARVGLSRTHVFLVAKPESDRLYVFVTGTERWRDWFQNAKALSWTTEWQDGYYYTPPGHAGFRRATLNVIGSILLRNEFDNEPLHCIDGKPTSRRPSLLSKFICSSGVRSKPDSRVSVVVAGHSRGAAVATLIAPALAGYEVSMAGGTADVSKQKEWPLDFAGLVGFAPPYSIYLRTDRESKNQLPKGAPDQWEVYDRAGIIQRTLMFHNERDIVPNLSLGLGRQIGHRFRISEDGAVEYIGFNSKTAVSVVGAHASGRYCQDVLTALDARASLTSCEGAGDHPEEALE